MAVVKSTSIQSQLKELEVMCLDELIGNISCWPGLDDLHLACGTWEVRRAGATSRLVQAVFGLNDEGQLPEDDP